MRKLIALGLVLVCVLSPYVFSQSTSATLSGTVQDSTGAVIPGVTIIVKNTSTGIVTIGVTNDTGTYQFASLLPGTYDIEAKLLGFETWHIKSFRLDSSLTATPKIRLEIGEYTTAIEVAAPFDTTLATSSNSIGAFMTEAMFRDLPLERNDANHLLAFFPGVQSGNGSIENSNIDGGRASQATNTRDGTPESDGRFENGSGTSVYASADLIGEVRIITSPVDAQMSRGSAQVIMGTRSGSNEFHGSLFWINHNSALDAGNWFDNSNGVQKSYDNRNQFGGRAGGPIIKNKTFFFFLIEGQRDLKRENATGPTLTPMARLGIFRYFPGVENANANSKNATVDRNGNPVKPSGALGDLAAIDLFGNCTFNGAAVPNCRTFHDPLRPAISTSAFMQETLLRMPPPNDFTGGDGLNTALVRFTRRVEGLDLGSVNGVDVNRNQYNFRIDHQFNKNHRLFFVGTREKDWGGSASAVQRSWPDGFDGLAMRQPDLYTISFASRLTPTLVNEFRVGRRQNINNQNPPANRPDAVGAEAMKLVPIANGVPFQAIPMNWQFLTYGGATKWRGHESPMLTIGDDISWTHWRHAFKWGFEFRNASSTGFGDPGFTPLATFGEGSNPVAGLDGNAFIGLSANATKTVHSLLTDLTASIDHVNQSFGIASVTNTTLAGSPVIPTKYYGMHAREISAYFKDEWKFHPRLTLNLGVHWEYYGQPFEENGLAARIVGNDESALTGVTCTSSLGTPGFTGVCSNLTQVQFVGRNSTNPAVNVNLKGNDLNNFAPAVGFSWNLPWFGGKTVLRSGYGISYLGAVRNYPSVDTAIGQVPGINLVGSDGKGLTYTPSAYTSISTLTLPIPFPAGVPTTAPFVVPVTDRTLTITTYNRVSPYVQNWNLEIQRQLDRDTTVAVRYIGTKGTKLRANLNLNQIDALSHNRDLFDAFNAVRGGGESALLDQMLLGINLGGRVVNGTTWTGAMALRTNSTTRAQLANGNVGPFLNFLNTSSTGTGSSSTGEILRRNGFPENYIVVNPQYASILMSKNLSNSSYHAFQLQFTRKISEGASLNTTLNWSKALGDSDTDAGASYRDPTNRSIEKTNLGFDRALQITSSGIYRLPFGKSRLLLANAPTGIQHIVGNWQLGGIMNYNSGAPLRITSGIQTISTVGVQPNIVGALPKEMGKLTKSPKGVNYFDGFTQITDPGFANISTLDGLSTAYSNKAIVDPGGSIVLVNPQPGQVGTLSYSTVKGPASLALDINLIKRFPISETREFEIRVDAINVLNHPNFGNPVTSINDNNFGQITTATGERSFALTLRFSF